MAWFAAVAPYAISAVSTIGAGMSAKTSADFQQQQLKQQAKSEEAVAQAQAVQERRQSRYIQSRVQALAASSGAGAMDKTVLDIMGGIEKEGEYRALARLYEGTQRASTDRLAVSALGTEAHNAYNQSLLKGAGTIMEGASTMYDKYAKDISPEYGLFSDKPFRGSRYSGYS